MQQFNKANLAREYRTKYGMKIPTLALARIMYNENKEVFKDAEDARTKLRYVEGKYGDIQKKALGTKNQFVMDEHRPRNPYKLPESDETKYEPYYIKAKKLAVLSDVHIPYHSLPACNCTLDKISIEKPDAILLNGDFILTLH